MSKGQIALIRQKNKHKEYPQIQLLYNYTRRYLDMKRLFLVAGLISLVGVGSYANEQNTVKSTCNNAPQMMQHCDMTNMQKELSLTPAQASKIEQLMGDKAACKSDWMNLKAKRKELGELMRSSTSSKEQALKLEKEISQQQEAIHQKKIEHFYSVKALLTPEQLKRWNDTMIKHEAKMLPERADQGMWQEGNTPIIN
jgi:Spy/CpxP family protein refolding chaperone